jgi:hypothetical protein
MPYEGGHPAFLLVFAGVHGIYLAPSLSLCDGAPPALTENAESGREEHFNQNF